MFGGYGISVSIMMLDTLSTVVDYSDSPSIVSSHNKGIGYSCIPLLFLFSGSVEYPMPYAFCSVVGCCSAYPLLNLLFSLKELCLSEDLGFYILFYSVHICTALWDSLSRLVQSGIVLSGFPGH